MLDTEDESRILFETSLTIYQLPQHNSPEDLNLGVSLYVTVNIITCFGLRMLQILPKLEGLCISESLCNAVLTD